MDTVFFFYFYAPPVIGAKFIEASGYEVLWQDEHYMKCLHVGTVREERKFQTQVIRGNKLSRIENLSASRDVYNKC